LDNISGGRCILGIGSSGPQVIEGWHGVPFDRPVGRTREIVDICRAVWRREAVVHNGRSYTLPLPADQGTGLGKPLKIINHPVRDRIPIYVASLGPKNVELTAEVAEGWYPTFFWPDKAKDVWGDSLAAGAATRDPSLPPLETATSVVLAIGENVEHLRELSRPHLALYIGGMGARGHNFYNELACRYGFDKEAALIQDLYLDGKRDEAMALVPDALVEGTTLIGPPGYVRERIAAFHEAGVTTLNVNAAGPDARAMIEQVKEWLP
jgi:F420-dependent oxidoreductase-like protein